MGACICHVDMDAFYVSVELLRRPELRGKPVVVGPIDPTTRGVVMTASYEARKFGVHSALPMAIARRRCPDAIVVPRDMERYREVSGEVMGVLHRFSDRVEVAGLDEAYIDLTDSPAPKTRARQIKHEVREGTGIVCSVGLAPNKLLAKIASDLDKPDGFCILPPERMLEAVGERPATLLPGVGPKTSERLEALGIRTVADLARADPALLDRTFGNNLGRALRERANGVDHRRLETERRRKSESREITFAHDVDDRELLRETVEGLAASVCASLAQHDLRGRTVTLKIRLAPFRTFTRSRTLSAPTRDTDMVREIACELLDGFARDAPVRLLGVGVAGLDANGATEDQRPAAVGEPLTLDVG